MRTPIAHIRDGSVAGVNFNRQSPAARSLARRAWRRERSGASELLFHTLARWGRGCTGRRVDESVTDRMRARVHADAGSVCAQGGGGGRRSPSEGGTHVPAFRERSLSVPSPQRGCPPCGGSLSASRSACRRCDSRILRFNQRREMTLNVTVTQHGPDRAVVPNMNLVVGEHVGPHGRDHSLGAAPLSVMQLTLSRTKAQPCRRFTPSRDGRRWRAASACRWTCAPPMLPEGAAAVSLPAETFDRGSVVATQQLLDVFGNGGGLHPSHSRPLSTERATPLPVAERLQPIRSGWFDPDANLSGGTPRP